MKISPAAGSCTSSGEQKRPGNYKIDGFHSKSWDEFAVESASKLDFVFTVSDDAANEVFPVWAVSPCRFIGGVPDPGNRRRHGS
jgi:hypothetical protein